MALPIYVVDAFTDKPFKGNPAGVCLTSEPLEDELMQKNSSRNELT
jgi:predicted PhzF superfamily epimerase YddE/YHI9